MERCFSIESRPQTGKTQKALHRRGTLWIKVSSSMSDRAQAGKRFEEAVQIMAQLRSESGCPWDREQSFDSIRKYTLEEVYEVFDAMERKDWNELCGELGDLLLQVLFYAQMADEAGYFTVEEVLATLNQKLIRRHPHVFGEAAAAEAGNRAQGLTTTEIDSGQVLRNWEEIKREERRQSAATAQNPPQGLLAQVPRQMPGLLEASKLGAKAAKVGFDWTDIAGMLEKVREEAAEVAAELGPQSGSEPGFKPDPLRVHEEMGDLLFTVANLARHLKVDPEMALRDANLKFRNRFGYMEAASSAPLEDCSLEQLEALWSEAKMAEKAPQA